MIDVSAALVLTLDGEDIPISASGSEIVVEVRRPLFALRALSRIPNGRRAVSVMTKQLRETGLTITVTREGEPLLRFGSRPAFFPKAAAPPVALRATIAGIVGSFAMDLVQDGFTALYKDKRVGDDRDEETEAIVGVVRRIAPLVPFDVARTHPGTLGRAIHYVFGCAFAGGYALARNRVSGIGAARGIPFGIALWFFSDALLIPLAKLGKPVWRYSAPDRANALLSHLAYAAVVEASLALWEA